MALRVLLSTVRLVFVLQCVMWRVCYGLVARCVDDEGAGPGEENIEVLVLKSCVDNDSPTLSLVF